MSLKLKEKNLSQILITLTDKLQKALKIKAQYKFTMVSSNNKNFK